MKPAESATFYVLCVKKSWEYFLPRLIHCHVNHTYIFGGLPVRPVWDWDLGFFWDDTSYVFGQSRSTALLGLLFCLAMVDCSSRVLFLPFMAAFKEMYLTSFFIGEGLSGFLPSVFALIQGVGGNPSCRNVSIENETDQYRIEPVYADPNFSVDVFFFLLFGMMVVSSIAFLLLNQKSIVKGSLVEVALPNPSIVLLGNGNQTIPSYQATDPDNGRQNVRENFGDNLSDSGSDYSVNFMDNVKSRKESADGSLTIKDAFFTHISKPIFFYLLVVQAVVCCFANGILPSIQSYSCLPYGNVAYHWAVTLSSIANPAVCFLAFYVPPPTKVTITNVMILGYGVAGYVLTTAIMSPMPPLVDAAMGEILLVLSWILVVAFFTYVKVSVAMILRSEGKRGLFWCGAVTQLGSTIGAAVTFGVVNYTNTFEGLHHSTGLTWELNFFTSPHTTILSTELNKFGFGVEIILTTTEVPRTVFIRTSSIFPDSEIGH
ncbi:unnamed protein product [Allacma fusca]|uniref:Riboflavin transporter n=1 Tax=Allacma fusca TaxID=39272 RepID=A0A8J2PLF8_9HEXA|nr:unnamed protein product [Allacma fusca]